MHTLDTDPLWIAFEKKFIMAEIVRDSSDPTFLANIAEKEGDYLRFYAALNMYTPLDVLIKLTHDHVSYVRESAITALSRRSPAEVREAAKILLEDAESTDHPRLGVWKGMPGVGGT